MGTFFFNFTIIILVYWYSPVAESFPMSQKLIEFSTTKPVLQSMQKKLL